MTRHATLTPEETTCDRGQSYAGAGVKNAMTPKTKHKHMRAVSTVRLWGSAPEFVAKGNVRRKPARSNAVCLGRPGFVTRRECEYEACGTCCAGFGTQPLAGGRAEHDKSVRRSLDAEGASAAVHHTRAHTRMRTHAPLHTPARTRMCAHTREHTCARTHACTHACTHTRAHSPTHPHTQPQTHKLTHTHTHMWD